MKKNHILVICLIFGLMSCKSEVKKQLDLPKPKEIKIKKKLDSNSIKERFLIDEGLKRISYFDSTNLKGKIKYLSYTKFGMEFKFGELEKGKQIGNKIEYEFDKEGFVTKISSYDSKGEIISKKIHYYDKSINQQTIEEYNKDGRVVMKQLQVFNEKQQLKKEVSTFGKIVNVYNYTYDNYDKLSVLDYTDEKGNLFYRYKYEYTFQHYEHFELYEDGINKGSNIVKTQYYGSNGRESLRWINKYDDIGNLIDSYVPISKNGLTYLENQVKKTYNYKGLTSSIERNGIVNNYQYDSLDNIYRYTTSRIDNLSPSPIIKYSYEIDRNNNWIVRKLKSKTEERFIEYY